MTTARRRGLHALGTLALLAVLAWAAHRMPWNATWQALRGFALAALAALVALNAAILWLFALRWWWLLRLAGYPVRWQRLAAYRLAAFSVSYFTPGSQFGGEPLQVFALHRHEGVPLPAATASVGLDKLLELVGNFAFLALGAGALAWLGLLPPTARWGLLAGAGGLALAAGLYLGAVCQGAHTLTRLAGWGPGALARLAQRTAQAETAARTICQTRRGVLAWGMALSLPTWVALVVEYGLMTRGLAMPLSLDETLVLMTAARLAFLLPLLPGGLGALEGGLMFATAALGYAPAQGLALALLIRLRDLTVGAMGLFLAHWYGLRPMVAASQTQS